MDNLPLVLSIIFVISLVLNYLSFSYSKDAMQIVNDMGIGYNLANSFDSYNDSIQINNPYEQITLLGNPIPTKKMIKNIKRNGFKTIRFPITWINFIDENGIINSDWMNKVKEVVDLIIEEKMYCIINIHHDGASENWLSKGISAKEKYITLWKQIADVFKDYNEHLIFESMNRLLFIYDYEYNYPILLALTQAFVDTIRNSGGNNQKRLLIISGADEDLRYTCSPKYKMPIDPFNKLAISIHYNAPTDFTSVKKSNDILYLDKWGADNDYNELIENFETMKHYYVDKGIPVIISEVGVLTEEKKNISSIREYLYTVFSFSSDYNGIMSCLWDTSNKIFGDMNYYNRETDEWYDEKIKNNFLEISKDKYIKTSEYYILTNLQNVTTVDNFGSLFLKIGNKKAVKIIFNAKISGKQFYDFDFSILSFHKNGNMFEINYDLKHGKKYYDGTYVFTIDISNEDCTDYIQNIIWYGLEYITFNNLTVEFEENYLSFNYKEYKSAINNKFK